MRINSNRAHRFGCTWHSTCTALNVHGPLCVPSALCSLLTSSVCPVKVRSGWSSPKRHTTTVRSLEQVAKVVSSHQSASKQAPTEHGVVWGGGARVSRTLRLHRVCKTPPNPHETHAAMDVTGIAKKLTEQYSSIRQHGAVACHHSTGLHTATVARQPDTPRVTGYPLLSWATHLYGS